MDATITRIHDTPGDSMRGDAAVARSLRTPRAAGIAGVVFALLLTAALVLVRLAAPTGAGDAAAWMTDPRRRGMVVVALNLVPFAAIAFLWFIGVVRDRIGAREDQFFATVFLGSGLLFVAMLFVASAVTAGFLAETAARSGAAHELSSLGPRIGSLVLHIYAMRMAAVFTISTATIGLRTGFLPRWLALFGYATAAVLLVAVTVTPWVELLFPLWIFMVSVDTLVENLGRAKVRGVGVALVFAPALLSACSTPLHTWDIHTASTPALIPFDRAALTREPVATLGLVAPAALQGLAPAVSHGLVDALANTSPPIRAIPAYAALSRLNEQRLGRDYGDLVAGFARSGVLELELLQRIGTGLNTPYALLPGIAEFSQALGDKFDAMGFKLLKTRLTTVRLWLQLWDARTGQLLWESSGEVTVAAQLLTQESAAVSLEDIAQRLWSRMIQGDLLGGGTRSRIFLDR